MLFVQPLEKLLEPNVGQDGFHGIEGIPKLVITPGLMDEILTRMTRRDNFGPAFVPRAM
jgi:hypothetical protein